MIPALSPTKFPGSPGHPRSRVLIIDDDPVVRVLLREMLSASGHDVEEAETGDEAEHCLAEGLWDLVLLDRRLPDCDGLLLLRSIREKYDSPVIVLTVMNDDRDRILGLGLGAHDYITKPFNPAEVSIRIRNLLRTRRGHLLPPANRKIEFGPFTLLQPTRNLVVDGKTQHLAPAEVRLMAVFLTHVGEVLDRTLLTQAILQRDWSHNDRSIDVLVARLRKRIEKDPKLPDWILTVHGAGYMFAPGEEREGAATR